MPEVLAAVETPDVEDITEVLLETVLEGLDCSEESSFK